MLLDPFAEPALAIYTGLPGSGKSYSATVKIVEWLRAGCPVVSNIRIKVDLLPKRRRGLFRWVDHPDMEVKREGSGSRVRRGSSAGEDSAKCGLLDIIDEVREKFPEDHLLVVVDEAQLYFNSRNYQEFPARLLQMISQHRHLHCSFLILTQHEGMLDVNFKRLALFFRRHTNWSRAPVVGMFAGLLTSNFHFSWSEANAGGEADSMKFDRSCFFIRKKWCRFYETAQLHDRADKLFRVFRPGAWRRKVVWVVLILGGCVIKNHVVKLSPRFEQPVLVASADRGNVACVVLAEAPVSGGGVVTVVQEVATGRIVEVPVALGAVPGSEVPVSRDLVYGSQADYGFRRESESRLQSGQLVVKGGRK